MILLVASYVFYAAWDYRFLALILFSTMVDYLAGAGIARCAGSRAKKRWLWLSIAVNLGLLGFFKYFNFFIEGFQALLAAVGITVSDASLHIVLPVGISFYTFQSMSYTIDIYRGEMAPTDRFLDFALFVAFFPQLVAGPIERATRLLPQITAPRKVTGRMCNQGVYLIFFGLFEKVVVADNLAVLVDGVYGGPPESGLMVLLATYAFAFQIFADFDGYSNMAKGLAALMGFDLTDNFRTPYFSRTPSEFWRRWHVSLSTWLRDYLYLSLGGNRLGTAKTARNLVVTLLLGGLWHGASWMFVLWGGFHALLLVAYLPFQRKTADGEGGASGLSGAVQRLVLFHLVCLGWMLFRAESPAQFLALAGRVVFHFNPVLDPETLLYAQKLAWFAWVPLVYQYLQYRTERLRPVLSWPFPARVLTYVFLFYAIVIFGYNDAQSFVYFQF